MSDLLSAASLLLAVISVLFGLWYPEIVKALEIEEPKHKPDRLAPKRQVLKILRYRSIPLTLAFFSLILVFSPDTIKIILQSVEQYQKNGLKALSNYSSVSTAFVLVILLAYTLTGYTLIYTFQLILKVNRLKK